MNFCRKISLKKMAVYQKVSNAITELEKKIPIDLIVHTKAMHRKFLAMQSAFSRHIASQGKVLYEKDKGTLAAFARAAKVVG